MRQQQLVHWMWANQTGQAVSCPSILLSANETQPDGIMTKGLRKLFSSCIAYIYAHACYLQKDKKQFLKAEIEKYNTYARLPMTREHTLGARMFKLLEEGELEW